MCGRTISAMRKVLISVHKRMSTLAFKVDVFKFNYYTTWQTKNRITCNSVLSIIKIRTQNTIINSFFRYKRKICSLEFVIIVHYHM